MSLGIGRFTYLSFSLSLSLSIGVVSYFLLLTSVFMPVSFSNLSLQGMRYILLLMTYPLYLGSCPHNVHLLTNASF